MLISQVELPVSTAAQAAHFDGDASGLPTRTGGGVVEIEVGLSVLLLHPWGAAEPGAYHSAITIPEDRFAEAKGPAAGARATAGEGRCRRVQVRGAVELPVPLLCRAGWNSARTDRTARLLPAPRPSGRFSSADLLRISEIGLAVPDVPAAVAALQGEFGLPVFGTAAAEFSPLGDPHGLLIVVRQGRPWFPTTTVTPSLGPIAVTVELPSGGKSLALTANCQVKAA